MWRRSLVRWTGRGVVTSFVLGTLLVPGPAVASCAGPVLSVGAVTSAQSGATAEVRAGAPVTATGRWFFTECYDQGETTGWGCSKRPRRMPPAQDVYLVFVQGGLQTVVAEADADEKYDVAWQFTLPAGATAGPARLVARAQAGLLGDAALPLTVVP